MTGEKRGRPHGGLPTAPNSSQIISAEAVVDDAIARTIVIREAIEDGAYAYAARVAEDLEHDLAGNLHQLREAA